MLLVVEGVAMDGEWAATEALVVVVKAEELTGQLLPLLEVDSRAVNSRAVNSPAVNSPAVNSPAVNSPAVNSPAAGKQAV